MMNVKVPKANSVADGLIKRTSSMLDETVSKVVHKGKDGDRCRKKVRQRMQYSQSRIYKRMLRVFQR